MGDASNQSGFTAFEGFLVLIVVGGLAGAFYFVSHKQLQKLPVNPSSSLTTPKRSMTFEKCAEAGGTISKKTSSSTVRTKPSATCSIGRTSYIQGKRNTLTSWTTVTERTVKLTQYNVQISLPATSIGKLMYRYDGSSGAYFFIPKAALTNEQCANYLFGKSAPGGDYEGDGIHQIKAATGLKIPYGIISYHAKSFGEYYVLHKAPGGNYFESNDVKYWKAGDNFYQANTSRALFTGATFIKACPGVTGSFIIDISNATQTLKEIK